MLKIVKISGHSTRYASSRLCDDYEFMYAAISAWGDAYKFTSDRLRANRTLAIMAIDNDGSILKQVPPEFMSDVEFVKYALAKNPRSLKHVKNHIKM